MSDKRCLDYDKAIGESAHELFALGRRQGKALLRDRMRFLHLLKSGTCTSQAAAGKTIGLQVRAAEKLWKQYKAAGLEGLLVYPYEGRKEKLTAALKQELQEELAKDQMHSLAQVQHFIEAQSGVHYSIAGVHYVLGRMKVKKKTGRPQYYDKDTKGEQRFKKNLSRS